MSVLFKIENKIVKPNPETLLIPPFKQIWSRDKGKGKEKALEDLTYVEFCTSQKKSNPYAGYDEKLRKRKVLEDIITQDNWEEDDLIKHAMRKVLEFQKEASITYSYYMASRIAADKIKEFFLDFDMTEKIGKETSRLASSTFCPTRL